MPQSSHAAPNASPYPVPPASHPTGVTSPHLPPSSPLRTSQPNNASFPVAGSSSSPLVSPAALGLEDEEAEEAQDTEDASKPPPDYCVLPGPDTVVTDQFQRWGVVVNTTHRTVICLDCKVSVVPNLLPKHLYAHGLRGFADEEVSEALAPYDLLQSRQPIVPCIESQSSRPSAVFGLNVIENCYFCSACHRGWGTQQSLAKNHFSRSTCNPSREFYSCHGQTFYSNHCRRVFPVLLPSQSSQVTAPSAYDLYLRATVPMNYANAPMGAPANHRVLNSFIKRERWMDHVNDLTPSFVQSIAQLGEGEHVKVIRSAASLYLGQVVSVLHHTSPQIKRQLAQFSE
ncbi:hypothetical protein EVJ58_g10426 [Rhodofomes roseus]|uniref:Uncharacterized protein n=1 Tax=Rhodofomes roseus TaxID=34475 RepID=A0A4Y9XNN3_9APHY|nr:hypothetical protein EVJ58_g10426 [Rhodofomes roseus]